VQIFEHPTSRMHDARSEKWRETAEEPWAILSSAKTDEFSEPFFALSGLPKRNGGQGADAKDARAFLIRAAGVIRFPAGEYTLLLRAFSGARVAVDGQIVADTSLKPLRYKKTPVRDDSPKSPVASTLPALPPGSSESKGRFSSDGQPHVLLVECLVGANVPASGIGELFVAVAKEPAPFFLLAPVGNDAGLPNLTPSSWTDIVAAQRERIDALNKQRQGGNR